MWLLLALVRVVVGGLLLRGLLARQTRLLAGLRILLLALTLLLLTLLLLTLLLRRVVVLLVHDRASSPRSQRRPNWPPLQEGTTSRQTGLPGFIGSFVRCFHKLFYPTG